MKKFIYGIVIFLLLNPVIYFTKVQFICDTKINTKKELNAYETFSALQAHLLFWLFGWVVDPSIAVACFNKQFHIHNSFISFKMPEDNYVKSVKNELLCDSINFTEKRLTWNNYTTKASICLNGSTISLFRDEFGLWFLYTIPYDYKPGIINIWEVVISETVFDYLENKGFLGVYTEYNMEKIKF